MSLLYFNVSIFDNAILCSISALYDNRKIYFTVKPKKSKENLYLANTQYTYSNFMG